MMEHEGTDPIVAHFSDPGRVAEYLVAPDAMNEARRDLVRRMVLSHVAAGSRVLEIGCGIGALTAELVTAGMLCTAVDSSPEMIRHARDLVGTKATIELRDFFDETLPGQFAAVIANGVAPYYRDTAGFLKRVCSLLQPGGVAFIVHKNALFNLFALNEGTIDFLKENLLAEFPATFKDHVSDELYKIPGLPEPRKSSSSAKLLRVQENPLTAEELYADAELAVRDLRYCFIHATPPRIRASDTKIDIGSLQTKYERRWEGMFLGSQFLVVASRR